MKLSIIKYFSFSCLTGLIWCSTGCYKDKGNYDLHPINEIKITAVGSDTFRVYQYDTLMVTATVTQSLPQTAEDLTYKWQVFEYPGSSVVNEILGKEKDLKAAIKVNPGNYTILYTVTDNKTGVSFFREYYMEVSSIYNEGWLLMEESDGAQDISLINPEGKTYRNIYATANDGNHLPANSFRIKVLNSLFTSYQDVYVLSGNTGVKVDYVSFRKQAGYENWFFAAPPVMKPQTVFYNKFGVQAFLVNDGEVYAYPFSSGGTYRFGAPYKGDYTISPIVFPMLNNDYSMFFDSQHQRFLKFEGNRLNQMTSPAGSAFDLNNIGKELVFGGVSNNDYHNCLFKDKGADKFYVYRINTTATIVAAEKYDVIDAPGIKDAKFFASSEIYLQLYYAVDNKIYLLDIPAQKARLAYTFPAGTVITAMKLKQAQNVSIYYPDNNKLLAVATLNQQEGKVSMFKISNTGDFVNNTVATEYGGFHKIIDLEYKNRR